MKIYTSYFANIKKLGGLVPISIAGYTPLWYEGLTYKKLAPTWTMFSNLKATDNVSEFVNRFWDYLDDLGADKVYNDLHKLANNKDIVLLCYEQPQKFCHRHVVANWLNINGHEAEEVKNY